MKQDLGLKDPKAEEDTVAGEAGGEGMVEVAGDTVAVREDEDLERTTVAIAADKDAANKSGWVGDGYQLQKTTGGKGKPIMRQKYTICRQKNEKRLSIKEYAILERTPRNPVVSKSDEVVFSFLGEETYNSASIVDSMGRGIDALVAALRTDSMFPIWPNAIKIAESVMDLYDLDAGIAVDLFFDDIKQLERNTEMPAD